MISLTFSEIFKKKPFNKNKYEKLILNLSGEKSFSKKKGFENLISVLQKSKFKKIIIFGKTYDKKSKQIINSVLKTNNKTKIKNIFDKTNFLQSTKLIDKCSFYIGFDTGLSNYAVESGKNALIISASGMPGKFFPRTTKEMKMKVTGYIILLALIVIIQVIKIVTVYLIIESVLTKCYWIKRKLKSFKKNIR